MGRREKPISQCSKSLGALATWLRAGRDEAGLTYHQLAARTDFSADTLARAASGCGVPQNLNVVTSYARACGRGTKEAERLWKHARRDEVRAQGVLTGHRGGAHISVVKGFADLHSAIVDLYQDDGSPPLRSLDPRLGSVGRLPAVRLTGSSRGGRRRAATSSSRSRRPAASAGPTSRNGGRPGTGRTRTAAAPVRVTRRTTVSSHMTASRRGTCNCS